MIGSNVCCKWCECQEEGTEAQSHFQAYNSQSGELIRAIFSTRVALHLQGCVSDIPNVLLCPFLQHVAGVEALAVSQDSNFLYTASRDSLVKRWVLLPLPQQKLLPADGMLLCGRSWQHQHHPARSSRHGTNSTPPHPTRPASCSMCAAAAAAVGISPQACLFRPQCRHLQPQQQLHTATF